MWLWAVRSPVGEGTSAWKAPADGILYSEISSDHVNRAVSLFQQRPARGPVVAD